MLTIHCVTHKIVHMCVIYVCTYIDILIFKLKQRSFGKPLKSSYLVHRINNTSQSFANTYVATYITKIAKYLHVHTYLHTYQYACSMYTYIFDYSIRVYQ